MVGRVWLSVLLFKCRLVPQCVIKHMYVGTLGYLFLGVPFLESLFFPPSRLSTILCIGCPPRVYTGLNLNSPPKEFSLHKYEYHIFLNSSPGLFKQCPFRGDGTIQGGLLFKEGYHSDELFSDQK